MPVMQAVKENPWKMFLGSSGAIITLIATLFTLDDRYAHAEDVARDKQEIRQVIQNTTSNLRKQMIEDKLFELDFKKEQAPDQRLTPIEAAQASRYKRQLEEIISNEKKDK